MTGSLAQLVVNARVQRLSLIGLSKNVGKTTATNHLLQTLLDEKLYKVNELGLTSLGLDGEATDAMTGLPKPRYIPRAGLLIATILDLLHQTESRGARFEHLQQLPGRTSLGPVILARVQQPGNIVIAGPTLLCDLRSTLDRFGAFGARLGIVDGAINRLGAAAPVVTDACVLCTGPSAAATPELAGSSTADVLRRLTTRQSAFTDVYMKLKPQARLLCFSLAESDGRVTPFTGSSEPEIEAH